MSNSAFLRTLVLSVVLAVVSLPITYAEPDASIQKGLQTSGPPVSEIEVFADDVGLQGIAISLPHGSKLRIEDLALDGRTGRVALDLERFRVFASNVRIDVDGKPSDLVPQSAYYRGRIEGEPDSMAVLAFRERGGVGGLLLSGGKTWAVARQLHSDSGPVGLTGQSIDGAPEPSPEFACMAVAPPDGATSPESGFAAGSPSSSPEIEAASEYTARIAIETDYEFSLQFANLYDARDYIGDLIAYTSTIYDREVDTNFAIAYVSLRADPDDPWHQTDASGALFEFASYWNQNRGDVTRSLAHMISGRDLSGIAYVGTLCNMGFAYGVSGNISRSFDIDNPTSVWDIYVVSHEIGHNFNSPHTHCYEGIGGSTDAVDHCYSSPGEDGCYSGTPELPCSGGSGDKCGTIMSYCHQQPGGFNNIALTLGDGHPHGVMPERVPYRMKDHLDAMHDVDPECLTRVGTCWDSDSDGICEIEDNCPDASNANQNDGDGDGVGDVCDNCPGTSNAGQNDPDGDGLGDACDACPDDPDNLDTDDDGHCDTSDNCLFHPNSNQQDQDGDGLGDVCDPCVDDPETADDVCAPLDVCPGADDRRDCNANGTPDGCEILDTEEPLTPWDNPPNGSFGSSIFMRGDLLIVGAPYDDEAGSNAGSAYVYRWQSGSWTAEAELFASNPAANDHFGIAVAIDGNVAVVGATGDDDRGDNSGMAHVFRYTGEGWTHEQELFAGQTDAGDKFGSAVAIDGDRIVVGAPYDVQPGHGATGAAYVFRHDGSTWVEKDTLTAIGLRSSAEFGASVAIEGEWIAVGAPVAWEHGDIQTRPGKVLVFQHDALDDRWRWNIAIDVDGFYEEDRFGQSVAISGDRIAVGAPWHDRTSVDPGAAFVYLWSHQDGRWSIETKLQAVAPVSNDWFGNSVSIHDHRIVVGAYRDAEGGSLSGAAYLFRFDTALDSWVGGTKITASEPAASDYCGGSVAVGGDRIAIAATGDDPAGSVYTYRPFTDCNDDGTPDECQPDADSDDLIDVCDSCPGDPDNDFDGDGLCGDVDACPWIPDPDQDDQDGDAVGDACDNCPAMINTGQLDGDADDHGDVCDCAPLDPSVYPGAPEINDGKDNQCPGDPGYGTADEIASDAGLTQTLDEDTFCWPAQIGASRYQIVRSTDDPSFASGCTVAEETGTCHTDTEDPPPGSVFHYLVRALQPNPGSWGTEGGGNERLLACAAPGTASENMASAHDRIVSDATVGVVSDPGPGSPNRLLYLDGEIQGPPPANWGLDRSNQRTLPLDQNGSVSGTGNGVHVYVVDTGIRRTHQEFTGRADCFFDWEEGNDCADGNGHGTFVASLVAGDSYGWASDAMVHAVRVLNNLGSGSPANIRAGLDAIAAGGEIPGVVVYPLNGGASDEIDAAVQRVIDAGFYVVAGAGTDNADACNQSPARVPEILTVGATDANDTRAAFSNWGSCVDLFAPGVDITGAWWTSDNATRTISGTHAAEAFVAGAVAIHAERGNLLANEPGTGGTP